MRRTRLPWALLFVIVVVIIAVLATSWNWVLVESSRNIFDAARNKWADQSPPWLGIVLGSLGFGLLIFVFSIFFAKLLREMRLNQLQKDFLAKITHELKTPLASLELSSSLLKNPDRLSDQEKIELWNNHDAELQRLRDEIEQLLTSSRWEQYQDKPLLQRIHLEEWLEEILNKWQRKIPQHTIMKRSGVKLEFNVDADPQLLDLILNNLIGNSLKFNGINPPEIFIDTEITLDKMWIIHVRDKGIGFRSEDSQNVFKRFLRLKHAHKVAIPGSGLGLHLASQAAKSMKMQLTAFSEGHHKGACFSLKGNL